MNLITCDQNCKHQQEGYCNMGGISNLTGSVESKCGYFERAVDSGQLKAENKGHKLDIY